MRKNNPISTYALSLEAIPLYALATAFVLIRYTDFPIPKSTFKTFSSHGHIWFPSLVNLVTASATALFSRGLEYRNVHRQIEERSYHQQQTDMNNVFRQGHQLLSQGKYDLALENFNLARRMMEDLFDKPMRRLVKNQLQLCILQVAICQYYLQAWTQADFLLSNELENTIHLTDGLRVKYLNLRACIRLRLGNENSAKIDFSESLSINPTQNSVLIAFYFLNKQYDEVIQCLHHSTLIEDPNENLGYITEIDPTFAADFCLFCAKSYLKKIVLDEAGFDRNIHTWKKARFYLENALQQMPSTAQPRLQLAEIYLEFANLYHSICAGLTASDRSECTLPRQRTRRNRELEQPMQYSVAQLEAFKEEAIARANQYLDRDQFFITSFRPHTQDSFLRDRIKGELQELQTPAGGDIRSVITSMVGVV